MKFTIDRATWRCGWNSEHMHGCGDTQLLNKQGFMCCLGHVARQCGCNKDALLEVGDPECVKSADNSPLKGVLVADDGSGHQTNSELSTEAVAINDCDKIDDATRESRLIDLFAKHGHELSFTGEFAT